MQNYIGKQIDRYRIDAEQGVGGMAVVYKAFDTRLEREVALKLIRTEQIPPIELDRILERFRREAKNLAKLTDVPGVVTLLDYGVYEQKPYMVMSFLPGGTLKDRLGKPMDPFDALEQLLPIAEALSIIHDMDIIHRDIKPSNLLINRFGKLALADFGIAKAFESGDYTLTGTGMGVGTPEYMAPEQWQGKTVAQSDIYSLGVVFYEMITGKKPYEADTASELFLKIMTTPLKNPREIISTIPDSICQFLNRCMAREVEKRTPTVKNMLDEMVSLLSGEPPVQPSTSSTPPIIQSQEKPQPRPLNLEETWDPISESKKTNNQPIKIKSTQYIKIINADRIRVYLDGITSMEFVRVPAGEFLMGAGAHDLNAEKDEKPQHRVSLDEYWMALTPTTNQQYRAYANAAYLTHWFATRKADFPVVNVSWNDAMRFCEWLSNRINLPVALPTEAQWEKAARGTDGRLYPWGNQRPNPYLANYDQRTGNIMPVGSFKAESPYGVIDMAGNTWEWQLDWFDGNYYSISPSHDPRGPSSGKVRSVRGGAWDIGGQYLRSSFRDWAEPENKFKDIGFRCVINNK